MGIRKSILPIGLAVILVFVMATAPMIISTPAFAQISITPDKNVLSIESKNPFVHKINPDTGDTISSVEITLDGSFSDDEFVNGGIGIAHNPVDGKIYVLLKISIDPGADGGQFEDQSRHLATINLQTGVATLVGETGVFKIASLTFNPGTLYSVDLDSGDLVTISTADGSVTNLCTLSLNDGTGLAYNPNDGLLYYTTDQVLQRIDNFNVGDPANSCVVTSIAIDLLNPTALVFFNSFLIAHFLDPIGDDTVFLSSITDLGADTDKGDMDHFSRDLTVIDNRAVGGTFIPIDTTALLLAGIQSSAIWMLPILVGATGVGAYYIKTRMNKDN